MEKKRAFRCRGQNLSLPSVKDPFLAECRVQALVTSAWTMSQSLLLTRNLVCAMSNVCRSSAAGEVHELYECEREINLPQEEQAHQA